MWVVENDCTESQKTIHANSIESIGKVSLEHMSWLESRERNILDPNTWELYVYCILRQLWQAVRVGSLVSHLLATVYSVREVFFGFAGHLEFFAGHLIEFNSSSSRTSRTLSLYCKTSQPLKPLKSNLVWGLGYWLVMDRTTFWNLIFEC